MSTRYKRTDWVRRMEDFSSGCSSGFRLRQWLIAGIFAIFTGISRLLPVTRWLSVTLSPGVPVVSTTGASSLKSPASIWRGVVFVALITVLMVPRVFAQCEISIIPSSPVKICPGESVTLNSHGACEFLMDNDFNDGNIGNGWQSTNQAVFTNPCGNGPSGSTDPYLWFGNTSGGHVNPRTATTQEYTISGSSTINISFDMRYAEQGKPGSCEGPDEGPNGGASIHEGVYLQYSTDSGSNWGTIQDWDPNGGHDSSLINWNTHIATITVSSNVMFRWNQPRSTNANFDHWGLDNIQISIGSTSSIKWEDTSGNLLSSNGSLTVAPSYSTSYITTITDSETNETAQKTVDVNVDPLACTKTNVDVWVADPPPDDGTEPNNSSNIWYSPDVWVRNKNDNVLQHQNVEFGQTNYVNVRVRNIGTANTSKKTRVEVYYTKASMNSIWPGWTEVGKVGIDTPDFNGEEIIAKIPWNDVPSTGHYCFYVRLVHPEDPMYIDDFGKNSIQSTRDNNNIAWRNFNVVDLVKGTKSSFKVNVSNSFGIGANSTERTTRGLPTAPSPRTSTIDIAFEEQDHFLEEDGTEITVDLGQLFSRWQNAGGKGDNVKILDGTKVQLLKTPATFLDIQMLMNEVIPIHVDVVALEPLPGNGSSRSYHLSVQQFVNHGLVGGVDYEIVTRTQSTDTDADGIKDVDDPDDDNDNIPDDWENQNNLNPLNPNDGSQRDDEGLSNLEKYLSSFRKGMTWKRHETLSTSKIDFVGCSNCEPYKGDTACSTKLPILCIKKESLPNPGLETDYYHGWAGGYIALTPPIAGSELTGIGDAKLLCEYTFGNDYRMAEFHDGNGGWGYYAYGNVDENSRFWTYINDQDANCWGSGAGAEPEDGALERLVEAMDCNQPNDCQYIKPFSNIADIHNLTHDETLSSLWVDYDNDADLDLLIVSNSPYAHDKTKMVYLYQNDGGSFTDVATEVGLTEPVAANSISIGDYDNDGDVDLLIGSRLFENDWNKTSQFNFIGIYKSSFVDYDNDGDLDIYGGSWGSPGKLYSNDSGTFTEVDGALGLTNHSKHYRSDNWADYDNDGDMDVLIVNGRREAVTFYRNDFSTTGHFTDITNDAGLANAGTTGYTDSAAWGDYDNDGDLDFYISAEHGSGNRVYRNDGNTFTDVTAELGISFYDGAHGNWGDYDNDGDLDLYTVTVRNNNRLYRNEVSDGKGFVETGEMASDASLVKWGGSWGDFDADGDLDYIVSGGGPDELYQNNLNNGNHWLHLNLIGTISNRSVIGATIYVKTGDFVQMRHIASYGNFSSQNTFPVSFGLGEHANVDTITIKWPSGIEQVLENVAVDQLLTVEEPGYCPDSICHVSTDGSNETGDGSEAKAFATIQHGIDVAKDGYTVLVHSGTYIENINFNGKNIIVKSTDGAEKTVIDGNEKNTVLLFKNGEKTTVDGFTLTHGYGVGTSGGAGGIGAYGNSEPILKNLIVTGNVSHDGGGISCNTANPTLINVDITKNTSNVGAGIYIDNCNYTLRNVTVADNHAKFSNMGGGIFSHSSGKLNAINSIFWNNTPNNIRTWGTPAINFSYSNLEGGWNGDGNIDTDPLFGNSYHLSDYSPAIGAGTSTDAPEIDIEGTPRPNPTGSNPDMGAYENLLGTPQQQLACSAEPTIKSVNNGFWDSPNTWSENRVPGMNDVVAIQKNHFIRIKTSHYAMIDGLCNHGMLTNWYKYWFANGYLHGYANMSVYAKSFIDNYGKIQGIDGYPYFYEGGHGSNVYLRTNGNLNNYTDAKILSGKGRSSPWRNGNGGYVATFAKSITNDGVIGAGDSDKGYGGRTFVRAFDKLTHTGLIHSGKSGNGQYSYLYVKAHQIVINGGSIIGYGYIFIDPTTISLLGAYAKIEGEEITIYGGEDTVIELKDLAEGAISSTGNITLAVGSGGSIDLSSITGKVFDTTGEVKIHTDNLKLDENVDLTNLIEASNVETAPAKIIYDVMVLALDQLAGQVGETISINFTVANNGPETDTYNIVVTDASGWNFGTLPATVSLDGAATQELDLQVTLPTSQADNVITLTVTSQADSTISKTIAVQVSAVAEFAEETEIDEEAAKAIMGDHKASGQLLDKSGNPVSGAIVQVGDKTAVTDENGNWEIVGLHKGEHTITASKEEYTFAPAKVNLTGDDTSQQVTVAVLTEPVSYRASGTILDKEDNPIAGVTVQIGDKTVITDATGYWEINGLSEGEYIVTASKEGYLPDSKPCVVSVNEKGCQPRFKLEPVLDVKVVPEPRIAKQGDNVTYTITVTNQGEGTATDVTLADVLPDNTNLVTIEALEGGSCEAETLTCSLPDLTPGATANVKVVVSNSQAETLINTVTVTTQQYPTDVKKTRTQVIPYLSVTLIDLPDPIEMLKVLHYSVAVELSHYAPTDATGITLVSQLPSGVELQSITSDYGVCDASAFPQITCQMTDLSVASADSVSHATVEMDVALKDAGLLVLNHEAKITANEYPAHLVRERTTVFIPEDIQVDLAFVIDVTGSMQQEMNGVIRALTKFTKEIDPSTAPLMALLIFGDEVKVAAFTRDLEVLRGAIADLTASGGGLCEEASIEALLVAIPHTQAGGDILFATDASPYADAEVDKVIELLRSKGIRFNAMITGDCSMPDSWNEWPN